MAALAGTRTRAWTCSSRFSQRTSARPRTLVFARVLLEDPYRTLGVASDADEKEIKRAYRRLALKFHPDVNQTGDAERRFVSIQQAYEVLTGKRPHASSGAVTRNQHNGWEFSDWFWSFSASRRWSEQHHARPPQDAARAPQERAVLHSQLAGLRQRAAIRHTKQWREERAAGGAGAAGAQATAPEQQQHQQQQQHHQHQHQHQQHQQHTAAQPVVDYDTTAMSDGVNMACGEGYDPWNPHAAVAGAAAGAAAATARPKFTATETLKSQVCGQLGGLKRRAAVKARADTAAAARRTGARWEPRIEENEEGCYDV